ncbi:hypothetical protein AAEX37_00993 [Oligella sp. MSHR50489EDL]|uniref:hypothetical protein n=1 Tax=Oligella sp. MSHR50489EDL TaxID=3139409 RepID=UPI003D81BF5A
MTKFNHTVLINEIVIDVLAHLHDVAKNNDSVDALEEKAISYLKNNHIFFSHSTLQRIVGFSVRKFLVNNYAITPTKH